MFISYTLRCYMVHLFMMTIRWIKNINIYLEFVPLSAHFQFFVEFSKLSLFRLNIYKLKM